MTGVKNIDPLDDYPDEPIRPIPVFEFEEYKKSFELWDPAEYQEPNGVYQPIHFAIDPTAEQHQLLLAAQAAFSQELIGACHAYIEFHQANPKPLRWKKGEETGKQPTRREERWKQFYLDKEKQLKSSLTAKGWPGRLANSILEQARAKLDSANEIAKRELRKAELEFNGQPTDHAHSKLQFWESRQDYHHFCLGDSKKALKDIQKAHVEIAKLEALEQTAAIAKKLLVLYELRSAAVTEWKESRVFPVVSVGGKDEGRWMNKTLFLREKKGDPSQFEFVIKYPKFLSPGCTGRKLPSMVLPVKLSPRSVASWKDALARKKALTFTLQPLKGTRWRVTGVYKEPQAPKFTLSEGKRIGIDQNAGFITVSCVDGERLLWVRKFKVSQKGTTEQHEARIHEVMHKVCGLARIEQAVIVIEDLRLVDKHKEFSSKKVRRHIQRIAYRRLQKILSRVSCREGGTVRTVNPAYSSILGRYRLPGMQVHLAAAAMIAWRDLGRDEVKLFQIGSNGLKIQGEDSPIVVVVEEGMPYVRSNAADPRFLANFYRFIKGVNASPARDCTERGTDRQSNFGDATARIHAHESEAQVCRLEPRTSHDQTCPAAGIGPKVRVIVRPKLTPNRTKSKPKAVSFSA